MARTSSPQQKKPRHRAVEIRLSPVAFNVVWCAMLLFHTFNGLVVLFLAAVHIFMSQPAMYSTAWILRIPKEVLAVAGFSYLALALFHFFEITRTISRSVRAKRLTFGNEGDYKAGESMHSSRTPSITVSPLRSTPPHAFATASRWKTSVAASSLGRLRVVCARDGSFGIHGRYFDVGFYSRQAIEIVLQTYQAHELSHAVPRRVLNRIVVYLILSNGTFTLVIDYFLRQSPGLQRFLAVCMDLFLEFSFAVLVPIAVIVPYAAAVDWSRLAFPLELINDDVWKTNLLSELRQVLVSSSVDYLATLFPHATLLLSLSTIKSLLVRVRPAVSSPPEAQRRLSKAQKPRPRSKTLSSLLEATRRRRLAWTLDAFGLCWSIGVAIVHSRASRLAPIPSEYGCLLAMHPWFASNASCAVVNVNCHRRRSPGSADDMTTALRVFDRLVLSKLIFSHCPALAIPAIVDEFPELQALETFNCTLVTGAWPTGLTRARHPHATEARFVLTNMTAFPEGLRRSDLPLHLSLLIHGSNLSVLPAALGDDWGSHVWPYLRLERTVLTSLPPSFARARVHKLSLLGNRLVTLPDVDVLQPLRALQVAENPGLGALPSSLGTTSELVYVNATGTNVSALPAWVTSWWASPACQRRGGCWGSFHGTPLCSDPERIPASLCGGGDASSTEAGQFRLDLVQRHRPVD